MSNAKEPQGLAFIKQIARLVCEEYGYDHQWSEEGDVFTVTITSPLSKFKAVFERDILTHRDSRTYETITQAFMTKLLRECRIGRDAPRATSTLDTPATAIH